MLIPIIHARKWQQNVYIVGDEFHIQNVPGYVMAEICTAKEHPSYKMTAKFLHKMCSECTLPAVQETLNILTLMFIHTQCSDLLLHWGSIDTKQWYNSANIKENHRKRKR